jgi:protein-S-isoprenylcysteine O-methyltransferase Ste14
VLIAFTAAGAALSVSTLARSGSGVLEERWKAPLQESQPLADKVAVVALLISFFGLLVFTSLEASRLHLLREPPRTVCALGLVLFVAGWSIVFLSLRENAFAAPVVKDQSERHQHVVETGVYAVVRHPMYAGAALLMIGLPLWLESTAGALFALVPIAFLALRIRFEEHFLRRELTGYDGYAARVRYRLIPFLW